MKRLLSVIIVLLVSFTLSAWGGPKGSSTVVSETETVSTTEGIKKTSEEYTADAVLLAKEIKLTESFVDKEFVKDGIGEVVLAPNGAIDGDTIHVLSDGVFIQVRFLGVDTKESTGLIQPWGKPSSNINLLI